MARQALQADAPVDLDLQVTLLRELADRLPRITDRRELVDVTADLVARACGADEVTVAVARPDGEVPGSSVRQAMATGRMVEVPDLATTAHDDLAPLAARGLTGAAVVPLVDQSGPVGALVAARAPGPFTPWDHAALGQAAAVVASALELQRATEVADRAEADRHKATMLAERRRDELAALEVMAQAFERFELAHALGVMADELVALRGIEVCRLGLVDPAGALVEVVARTCFGARLPDPHPSAPDRLAVERGGMVLWRRPSPADRIAVVGLERLGLTSVMAMPVPGPDRALGTILVGSTGGHRLVTDEHVVVVGVAAQLLSRAVERRFGIEGLHRLAVRSG